jgi:hypothetical protein
MSESIWWLYLVGLFGFGAGYFCATVTVGRALRRARLALLVTRLHAMPRYDQTTRGGTE